MPTPYEKIAAAVEAASVIYPKVGMLIILDLICIGVEIGQEDGK